MNEAVANLEVISRFAMSSRHYGTQPLEAKFPLFMPPDDLRMSVYRTSGIAVEETWALGQQYVADPQQKQIKGKADLLASELREHHLEIIAVTEPHYRHAEIVGWPPDRVRQRLLAVRLAKQSTFSLRPAA